MGRVPARVELLSESERTRVVRLHLAHGRSVVRKEFLGPRRAERMSHELSILRRLSGVGRVVQLAAHQPDDGSILLEDVRGVALAGAMTPYRGNLDLMLELARAVAAIHQHGVAHCDINPRNIILAGTGDSPYLIDFALAMTFAELRPEFTHHNEIIGTLPYIAPEQTGRTGRPVDRRADLYGLGATFYELATGQPPFGVTDPLRLIRDHLAQAPVPPASVNPAVQLELSEIILHLLQKEPDNRYQTAEGLVRDLEQVRDGAGPLRVGGHDVPLRLTAPSRLVGRDDEIGALRAAFAGALAGRCRGVVISGAPGVGKSALIEELRPIVTAGDGWFTAGKFDQYRRDQEYDGVRQAFRGLGRLLLAEPEDELTEVRQRLLQVLGPNAGMATAVVPEFATLLKVPPDPGDPLTAQVRARRSAVEILRAIASRKRPVVFVIDDLQWAGATPMGLLDLLLGGDEEVEGLLTVAVYREGEVGAAHPLAPLLARWQRDPDGPVHLRLSNLDAHSLATMVGEMLHLGVSSAADLARSAAALTHGNPHETVELLNGLRREGLLRATDTGWQWDSAILEGRLAREGVTDVMAARIDGMPAPTRFILEAVACLGGEVELGVLEIATDLSAATAEQRLAPALEDGLLVMVAGGGGVQFCHDRLRETVLSAAAPARLRALRLRMARRLAVRPELFAVAADQYLPVVDALDDPQERRQAATLLRQAADQAAWIGNSLPAERLLTVAGRLTDDPATLLELHIARHAALYSLGRLEDADEVYRAIIARSTGPVDRIDATRVQISSLTNRNRTDDAIGLGLDLLRQLGWAVPTSQQLEAEIDRGLEWLYRWVSETSETSDLSRPAVSDSILLSTGALISRLMPASFFRDQATMSWLAVTAARIWAERGPTRTLVGAVSHVPWVLVGRRQDYRTAHRLLQRVLTVGEKFDFEPDLAEARFLYALGMCHWFHPLEEEAAHTRRALEGLIRGGDLQTACHAFSASLSSIELVATVDDYVEQVEGALAFAARTGNEHAAGIFLAYRWLAAALRGEPAAAYEARLAPMLVADPVAANTHVVRALVAAVFDDARALAEHSAAAMSLLPTLKATYGDWQAHLLRAIALADRIRSTREHAAELVELDAVVDWMALRAADMPTNFMHMLSLVEAERAWAKDDFRTAIHAFDSALRDSHHRPWHRAYIAERSAKFHLSHGLDHAGWALLAEAREAYRAFDARAKVDQLEWAYPSLDISSEAQIGYGIRRPGMTTAAIDMLGILAASQALSSETSIGSLRAKVVEVLAGMTGATDVGLFLWDDVRSRWLVATATHDGADLVAIDQPGKEHVVPHSVIRYVERTREPLIVGDATRDDRFSRDPYFIDLECCSLLAVPVLSRGALQAILLVENRLIRGAFSTERLGGIVLIAGQLAVSLDNALVYASLERKVAERTEQLALANERLAQLSVTDPLTGLANRRRLKESLLDEWLRARQTGTPLGLAMIDIDHFKRYNDRYGHGAGDRCLRRVADQLRHSTRDTDLVARYGGEEFAIVMPGTDATSALAMAEQIRAAVGAPDDRLTAEGLMEGADEMVTVSVGVAVLSPTEHEDMDELLERADAALYQAKRSGRNRVCSTDAG